MSSISSSSPSASTSSQSNGRDELLEQNLLEKEDQFDSVDVGDYDPKIKQHLEELNRFATKINQLEQCYEEENAKFQKTLNESSVHLNKLMKKCGERSVTEARPYYEALHKHKLYQNDCQVAAIKFEKFNKLYLQAKQTISDTELMFHKEMREDDQKPDNFDQFWQEKLNLANIKFMEAKVKSKEYEDEHMRVMAQFTAHQAKVSELQSNHKNSIRRTKQYFDEAGRFDLRLKSIKDNIEKLAQDLKDNKRLYAQALRDLEHISEEIHERRAQILAHSLKREPCDGAENVNIFDDNLNSSDADSSPVEKKDIISQQNPQCLPDIKELEDKFANL